MFVSFYSKIRKYLSIKSDKKKKMIISNRYFFAAKLA